MERTDTPAVRGSAIPSSARSPLFDVQRNKSHLSNPHSRQRKSSNDLWRSLEKLRDIPKRKQNCIEGLLADQYKLESEMSPDVLSDTNKILPLNKHQKLGSNMRFGTTKT